MPAPNIPTLQDPNQIREQFREMFGKYPLPFEVLLRELNDNGWPALAEIHPIDFFNMSQMNQVHKDNHGPYFYIAATKIRPSAGGDGAINLTDWEPNQVQLADFVGR